MKRFINADELLSTGTGFLGYNMFAYCENNPVMYSDPSGRSALDAVVDFFSDAYNEIRSAFETLSPLFKKCSEATQLDSDLPYVDSVIVPITIGLSIGAVLYGVKEAAENGFESILSIDTDRGVPEIIPRVEEEESTGTPYVKEYNYWTADIIDGYVVPGIPLTYDKAFSWAASDKNLLCRNKSYAMAIASYFPYYKCDKAHHNGAPGFLDHFHLDKYHYNHIWYFN